MQKGVDYKIEKRVIYHRGCNHVGVKRKVVILFPGVGECDCLECEGSGWWNYGPLGTECDCVDCKGTGRVLVAT
jgi:hypothetical protein